MNCEEYRAAVLAGEETDASRIHRQECPACRSHHDDLVEMRRALSDPGLWEEPSPELGIQIDALINHAADGDWRKQSTGHLGWWAALAVAVAALIVGIGSFLALREPAPDWEIALPATDQAPNAVAQVRGWNTDSGTRMVLEVEGLAPAPEGFMYEFWLSEGPLHISAGTFRTGGEIELWAAVRRADFPRLWVTLEPIDEDESPYPTTVLDTGREDV